MAGVDGPLAFGAFLVSGFIALALVRYFDLWERERPWTLFVAALLGFATMRLMPTPEGAIISLFPAASAMQASALAAAVCEELARLTLILVLAFVILRRHFDDPLDGLIYGAAIGIGMAVEEGCACWGLGQRGGTNQWLACVQAAGAIGGHLVFGAIVGYAVGLRASPLRYLQRLWWRWLPINVALAMALHLSWNLLREWDPDSLAGELLAGAARWVLILIGILYFAVLASVGYWRSQGLFAPGTTRDPRLAKINHAVADFWSAIRLRPPIVKWHEPDDDCEPPDMRHDPRSSTWRATLESRRKQRDERAPQ